MKIFYLFLYILYIYIYDFYYLKIFFNFLILIFIIIILFLFIKKTKINKIMGADQLDLKHQQGSKTMGYFMRQKKDLTRFPAWGNSVAWLEAPENI